METPTNQQRANRWVKYMGAGFIIWAALVLAIGMSWPLVSKILAAGLFMLLFAPERIDDERVRQLKLKAIMGGYGAGVTLVALHDFLGNTALNLVPRVILTAFDGFIIANVISLTLFHCWRWQDGRAAKPE